MLPVANPSLTKLEEKYLLEAYRSGYISSSGSFINRFEEVFREFHNTDFAISCNSGTSALHLALASLGIGRNHEVIIPSLTFIAVKNAVLYQHAVPVVADIDPKTWCIDIDSVSKQITGRTKAIIAVHLYGNPCDMRPLMDLCRKKGIHLIEDCAESIGSMYEGCMVGTLSTVSCFSFYGNKSITTGQGGMILTNSSVIAKKANHIKNQCMLEPYHHDSIGYNYRMTNLEAAIGLAQMKRIDEILEKKVYISDLYRNNIKFEMQSITLSSVPIFWVNSLLVEDSSKFREYLMSKGIETRPGFNPMSDYCSNANKIWNKIVYLPSGPNINDKELEYIVEVVNEYSS